MVGYSLANVFSQPLAKRVGSAQLLFLRGLTITLLLAVACLPEYHRLNHHWGSLLIALILGIAGYLPVLAFTHGVKVSRISIVTPIAGTATLFSVLLAYIFLHSSVSGLQWFAIALVILANILVSINIRDIRQSNVLQLSSGIPSGLTAALGWGVFFFLLIYPTRVLGPWLPALFVELGVTIAAVLHLVVSRQKIPLRAAYSPGVVLNGVAICIGTVAYTVGVHDYNIPIVVTLANSPALLSTFLGIRLFKEKLRPLELWAGAIMIAGVAIISLG